MNRFITLRILVCTVLYFCLMTSSLDAQTRWQKRFNMGEDEPVGSAIPTPDGGYIMTGGTSQTVFADIYVIKTDQDGDTQWMQTYEFGGATQGKYIRNTPDGGYIVFGNINSGSDDNIIIHKLSPFGDVEWTKTYVDESTLGGPGDIIVTSDGGYAFLSSQYLLDEDGNFLNRQNFLYRLDSAGNILWSQEYGTESSDFANSLFETSDGGFAFTGSYIDGDNGWVYNAFLQKVDANGMTEWVQFYSNLQNQSSEGMSDVIETSDGGFIMCGESSYQGNDNVYIIKTDATGNITWTQQFYAEQNATYGNAVVQTSDGNFVVYGRRDYFNAVLIKLDASGNTIWEREIPELVAALSIYETTDEGLIICGEWDLENTGLDPDDNIALLKLDGDGLYLPKGLVGNVYRDFDANCLYDTDEEGLENVVVRIQDSQGDIQLTSTDTQGDYFFSLDTGNYVVSAFLDVPYMEPCQLTYTVDLTDSNTFDSTTVDIPMRVTEYCPYLEVDVSSFALRECFDNIYTVSYCNLGTVTADDAYIELTLEDVLSIPTASIPYTGPNLDNVYTFDLGNLDPGTCGTFSVNIQLPCDTLNAGGFLGRTYCVDAHIYPDTLCGDVGDMWDGSSIEVSGECDQDSVRFRIRNIGTGNMIESKEFFVIEDQIMFMQGDFQLESGESMEMAFFAGGGSYRLEAEQSDDHPGESNPSVDVEGCGNMLPFSLGFINQLERDDRNPFLASECREVTGSYDPNDKQGFPVGYGEEHYIYDDTELEYLIRFQNTGTDTAFTVVIRDEISPLLDITTINPGASSHPYEFKLIDRMAKFTFNDIFLVDSLTNEPESHGFVKFRINLVPDIALGAVIENQVGIYFDFNAPIITNTTFHTIGEDFITIELVSNLDEDVIMDEVKAYPNPFDTSIRFELGREYQDVVLKVYDTSGSMIRQQSEQGSSFIFERETLSSGLYFFTIQSQGIDIAQGKMMVK